jgi:hypothetical protein
VTAAERAAYERLTRLADRLAPGLRAAFLAAVRAAADAFSLRELERAIERLGADGILGLFDTPETLAALESLRATYGASVLAAATDTTRLLPSIGGRRALRLQFPVTSPSLASFARAWENDTFARVRRDMLDGVRETVAQEIARGVNPRQIAVALKSPASAMGLTAYDAKIVASFRAALRAGRDGAPSREALQRMLRDRRSDPVLARAIAGGRPLDDATVDRMVGAYRRKLVAFRAETFARTAAIDAANAGQLAAWEEQVRAGVITANAVRRYWIVSPDERLCAICSPVPGLNADGIALDGMFRTPQGLKRAPTLHPNCRCVAWVRLVRAGTDRRPAPGTMRLDPRTGRAVRVFDPTTGTVPRRTNADRNRSAR